MRTEQNTEPKENKMKNTTLTPSQIESFEGAIVTAKEYIAQIDEALENPCSWTHVIINEDETRIMGDDGRHEAWIGAELIVGWSKDWGFTPIEFDGRKLRVHAYLAGMANIIAAGRPGWKAIRIDDLLKKYRAGAVEGMKFFERKLAE